MDKAYKAECAHPKAFEVVSSEAGATPLVYASPHSGRYYPESFLAASRLGRFAIRVSEDAYVDTLLEPASSLGVPVIRGAYARAFIDLNRDPNELDASMFIGGLPPERARRTARVAAGLGAVARIVAEGQEIYRNKIPSTEAFHRISEVHQPYHEALAALLSRARETFGCSVLLDWHSMPSAALAPDSGVDVVIGDRFGTSCASFLLEFAERSLKALGLRTRRNVPFAGGYTTEFYGDPATGAHALQIELNRALYLDEKTLTLLPQAETLQRLLATFTANLKQAMSGSLVTLLRPPHLTKLAGE